MHKFVSVALDVPIYKLFDYKCTFDNAKVGARVKVPFGRSTRVGIIVKIFLSIDNNPDMDDENSMFQIPDQSEPYNIALLNAYLLGIMKEHLTEKEYDVIRLSYGLDCDKMSAKDIADKLEINGTASYVRVSQIKKEAIDKLVDNVPSEQVIDYL